MDKNLPAPKKSMFRALATFRTITTKSIKQVNPLAIECMICAYKKFDRNEMNRSSSILRMNKLSAIDF